MAGYDGGHPLDVWLGAAGLSHTLQVQLEQKHAAT
jgi:hypothetical protein